MTERQIKFAIELRDFAPILLGYGIALAAAAGFFVFFRKYRDQPALRRMGLIATGILTPVAFAAGTIVYFLSMVYRDLAHTGYTIRTPLKLANITYPAGSVVYMDTNSGHVYGGQLAQPTEVGGMLFEHRIEMSEDTQGPSVHSDLARPALLHGIPCAKGDISVALHGEYVSCTIAQPFLYTGYDQPQPDLTGDGVLCGPPYGAFTRTDFNCLAGRRFVFERFGVPIGAGVRVDAYHTGSSAPTELSTTLSEPLMLWGAVWPRDTVITTQSDVRALTGSRFEGVPSAFDVKLTLQQNASVTLDGAVVSGLTQINFTPQAAYLRATMDGSVLLPSGFRVKYGRIKPGETHWTWSQTDAGLPR